MKRMFAVLVLFSSLHAQAQYKVTEDHCTDVWSGVTNAYAFKVTGKTKADAIRLAAQPLLGPNEAKMKLRMETLPMVMIGTQLAYDPNFASVPANEAAQIAYSNCKSMLGKVAD